MKIIILVLLVCESVLSQDGNQQYLQNTHQPTLQPAQPRLEYVDRTGYSISHGDAQSTVNVNLESGSNFHQPQAIQLGHQDVSSGELFTPQPEYYHGQEGLVQYSSPQQSYLSDLATKQYLNINPNNAQSEIISQGQPQQQLYNVGYSINIENNSPKLRYRLPMPPPQNAHSYRQQKLLNAEVITGTHKDAVEKPSAYNNYDYTDTASSNVANYIPSSLEKGQYAPNIDKQSVTKVYSDVRNTHGYTWKSLSPGVEISGYHHLNDMSQEQQAQANTFDHAAALGRSQGFDISNVVENGKTQYQPHKQAEAYEINKGLSPSSNTQVENIEIPSTNTDSHSYSQIDNSEVDFKFDTPIQNSFPSHDFNTQIKSSDLGLNTGLISGSHIEFDKSLLDGFYKNYNPVFYQPEVTLSSPNIPKNININLHGAASHQIPSYNFKFQSPHSHLNSVSSPQKTDSQMHMINQHYAFVQALDSQPSQGHSLSPLNSDVKPVTEQQEDTLVQPSQQQVQVAPIPVASFKEQKVKGTTEHKKYVPQNGPSTIRQYRPVVYVNDKNNYRMKNMRPPPPPMIIIHQKY